MLVGGAQKIPVTRRKKEKKTSKKSREKKKGQKEKTVAQGPGLRMKNTVVQWGVFTKEEGNP